MNKWIGCGRLVRDPEVRFSPSSQMTIAKYTLAIDRKGKKDQSSNEPTADFINCVAFGKAGEFAEKYFKKGLRVLVSGRLQIGSYTNKDGQKINTADILVEEQEFADGKSQENGNYVNQRNCNSTFPNSTFGQPTFGDGFMNIPDGVEDSGLPFN